MQLMHFVKKSELLLRVHHICQYYLFGNNMTVKYNPTCSQCMCLIFSWHFSSICFAIFTRLNASCTDVLDAALLKLAVKLPV